MPDPLLSAAIGFLGVLLGVLLKYLFDSALERQKAELERTFRQARASSYADFLKAVADIAISQRTADAAREREAMARLLDAKARIVVYGSVSVIGTLSEFIRHGAVLTDDAAIGRYVAMCGAMRRDAGADQRPAPAEAIRSVLFG